MGIRQGGSALGGLLAALALPPIAVHFGFRAALVFIGLVVLLAGISFALWYRGVEAPRRTQEGRGLVRSLLGNRRFQLVTAFALVFMGVAGTSVSYIAVTAHERGGLDAVAAGAVLAMLQLGGFSGRFAWGWLSDHMGRREPALLVMAAGAVGVILAMSQLRGPAPFWLWAAVGLLLGLFGHGWSGNYLAALAEVVDLDRAATATGLSLALSMTGIFVIPPLFGAAVDRLGYSPAWLALAVWSGLGVLAAGALWRWTRPGRPTERSVDSRQAPA
jgi:predicted MFS family arabinose efflux permease